MSPAASVGKTVGAVVVNRDAGTALLACVESLAAAGVLEIVVVDNDSHDDSIDLLEKSVVPTRVLQTGTNLGYGSAINRGLRELVTPYVLFANPDLILATSAAAALLTELESEPDRAIVGPLIVDPAGKTYPSARQFPSFGVAAVHALIGFVVPNNPWSRKYRRQDVSATSSSEVDWVSGACGLVRRVAMESIGGFDEGYFMYVEDLDLCWRLRRAAWTVRFVPDAKVVHTGGLSASRHPYRMLVAHHRSTWRFARKSASGKSRVTLPIVAAGLVFRLVSSVAWTRYQQIRAQRSRRRSPVE